MNVKDLMFAIEKYSKEKTINRINVSSIASLHGVILDFKEFFEDEMVISVFTKERKFMAILYIPLDAEISLVYKGDAYDIFLLIDDRFFVFDDIPKEIVDKLKEENKEER